VAQAAVLSPDKQTRRCRLFPQLDAYMAGVDDSFGWESATEIPSVVGEGAYFPRTGGRIAVCGHEPNIRRRHHRRRRIL